MRQAPRPARIEARGWGARHPGRRAWAVRDVDLEIRPGERVLLLGRSGSGKSTLLLALAGLLDPQTTEQAGELLVDGRDPRAARERTGLLLQDPEAQIVMGRAADDVAFGLENRCVPETEIAPRVQAALHVIGFPYRGDRSTDALSGGEKQLLALAGTVALRPALLLLDEPTANLDEAASSRLRAAVERIAAARDVTLVVVEHRVDEWVGLMDRVVVLGGAAGVLADGAADDVIARDPAELIRHGVWAPGFAPAARPPRRSPGAALIVGNGLAFRYPGERRDAVAASSVELHEGEALTISGATGSGKSTLSLLMGGLLRPSRGRVAAAPALATDAALLTRPLADWPARRLVAHVGSVFQDPEHQFLARTVRDELALGPKRAGVGERAAAARASELLDRLGLAGVAHANPFTLSGGEKRRLSVATAIATGPGALILDEPTFGQDPAGWLELLSLLRDLRDEGHGLAIVTHDARFAAAIGGRTLELPEPS